MNTGAANVLERRQTITKTQNRLDPNSRNKRSQALVGIDRRVEDVEHHQRIVTLDAFAV